MPTEHRGRLHGVEVDDGKGSGKCDHVSGFRTSQAWAWIFQNKKINMAESVSVRIANSNMQSNADTCFSS